MSITGYYSYRGSGRSLSPAEPTARSPRLGSHAAARTITCPQCGAPAGRGCKSTSGTPSRGGYTHVARRAAAS